MIIFVLGLIVRVVRIFYSYCSSRGAGMPPGTAILDVLLFGENSHIYSVREHLYLMLTTYQWNIAEGWVITADFTNLRQHFAYFHHFPCVMLELVLDGATVMMLYAVSKRNYDAQREGESARCKKYISDPLFCSLLLYWANPVLLALIMEPSEHSNNVILLTNIFTHCMIICILFTAVFKWRFVCVISLVFVIVLKPKFVCVVPAVIVYLVDSCYQHPKKEISRNRITLSRSSRNLWISLCTGVVTIMILSFVIVSLFDYVSPTVYHKVQHYVSYMRSSSLLFDYRKLMNMIGIMDTHGDLAVTSVRIYQPRVGIWWYFQAQAFSQYWAYFQLLLSIQPFIYILPLILVFSEHLPFETVSTSTTCGC